MSKTAYIGIGSNMGSPLENCRKALAHLDNHHAIDLITQSSFYETEPVGMTRQDWFVNAAAKVATELEPDELLASLLEIEKTLGRVRAEKWGPRIIDLDLLLYEDRIVNSPDLQIPHPEMHHRQFVLTPLNELAPHLVHPVTGKTFLSLLGELPDDKKVFKVHTSP